MNNAKTCAKNNTLTVIERYFHRSSCLHPNKKIQKSCQTFLAFWTYLTAFLFPTRVFKTLKMICQNVLQVEFWGRDCCVAICGYYDWLADRLTCPLPLCLLTQVSRRRLGASISGRRETIKNQFDRRRMADVVTPWQQWRDERMLPLTLTRGGGWQMSQNKATAPSAGG